MLDRRTAAPVDRRDPQRTSAQFRRVGQSHGQERRVRPVDRPHALEQRPHVDGLQHQRRSEQPRRRDRPASPRPRDGQCEQQIAHCPKETPVAAKDRQPAGQRLRRLRNFEHQPRAQPDVPADRPQRQNGHRRRQRAPPPPRLPVPEGAPVGPRPGGAGRDNQTESACAQVLESLERLVAGRVQYGLEPAARPALPGQPRAGRPERPQHVHCVKAEVPGPPRLAHAIAVSQDPGRQPDGAGHCAGRHDAPHDPPALQHLAQQRRTETGRHRDQVVGVGPGRERRQPRERRDPAPAQSAPGARHRQRQRREQDPVPGQRRVPHLPGEPWREKKRQRRARDEHCCALHAQRPQQPHHPQRLHHVRDRQPQPERVQPGAQTCRLQEKRQPRQAVCVDDRQRLVG